MTEAADEVEQCVRVLRKARLYVLGEVLKGQGQFVQMTHYPVGDVYECETHSNAHREAEHDHLHCFPARRRHAWRRCPRRGPAGADRVPRDSLIALVKS